QKGNLVFSSKFDAPDSESYDELWARLSSEPRWSSEEVSPLTPTASDPLRAQLDGSIEVKLLHGGTVLRRASFEGLALMRKSAANEKWFLPESELKRAKVQVNE
ncbi:MAG: hypothetical protein AAF517_18370, partial [Planctomycetota bacterium]